MPGVEAKGYLEELRLVVGKRPLIVPGACVMIRDAGGRVLLHRRADNGAWDLIGGSMEPGETFEQTARREVHEEIGVTLGELELVEVYAGDAFFHTYPNGDQVCTPLEWLFRLAACVASRASITTRSWRSNTSHSTLYPPH
jgi:8-oxo-dGTP pyrophosphatase MutT (NUDIX family)